MSGKSKRKRSSTSSINEDISSKVIDKDILKKYSPSQTTTKKKRKVKKGKKDKMASSGDTKETDSSINKDIGTQLENIMEKLDCIVKKEEIIDIVRNTIQQEMEGLVEKITKRVYDSVSRRIDIVESETHKMNLNLDKCKSHIKTLENEIQTKDEQINQYRRAAEKSNECQVEKGNDLEQYSRSNNLRIINLPEDNGERFETATETTEKVVKFLNEKMNTDIQMKDIDIAHRLGKKTPNKPRAVIVKFLSRRHKFESMKDRKQKLNGTGIYISEDLTRMNQMVFSAARRNTEVESCWTRNGRIVVKWKATQRIELVEYKNYKYWTGDV